MEGKFVPVRQEPAMKAFPKLPIQRAPAIGIPPAAGEKLLLAATPQNALTFCCPMTASAALIAHLFAQSSWSVLKAFQVSLLAEYECQVGYFLFRISK